MTNSIIIYGILLLSCGNAAVPGESSGNTRKENYMTMKIDGKEWKAEQKVEGALLGGVLAIGGKNGAGSSEQEMTINIKDVTAAGTYTINNADARSDGSNRQTGPNTAQLSNLTSSNYLCGGLMQGNQLTVVISKATAEEIEGRFSGTMQCVDGKPVTITDGKFYYHE